MEAKGPISLELERESKNVTDESVSERSDAGETPVEPGGRGSGDLGLTIRLLEDEVVVTRLDTVENHPHHVAGMLVV